MRFQFKKRTIIAVCLIICLLMLFSAGTLAYFTFRAEAVVNRFRTAHVDSGTTSSGLLFSVNLYEESSGQIIDSENSSSGFTFDHLAPGSLVEKKVWAKNTGFYSAYIRLNLTLSDAQKWQDALVDKTYRGETITLDNLLNTIIVSPSPDWTLANSTPEYDEDADTLTWHYYYSPIAGSDILDFGQSTTPIFESVKYPDWFNADDLLALQSYEMSISLDAIQSDNTGDSAQYAFETYWDTTQMLEEQHALEKAARNK